ncbi:hypothetical protein ACH5RR_030161 [Cinchona calisaya]|uniref:Uncharacterized protein n=1 Tax=Cinchona calisaya TaxID=153742 RepID=A0ABD2YXI9_9GENT
MAVDVCSEISSSLVASPRISFSHDLKEADIIPVDCQHRRSDALLLESIDFNFCISQSFSQELLSSADELFSNGKILPGQVKKITSIRPNEEQTFRQIHRSKPISSCFRKNTIIPSPAAATSSRTENEETALNSETKKMSLKELLSISPESDAETEQEKKPASKPFWQFRRSSSLNFDTCRRTTLIRSLNFLSRSNSTGSTPNPKPSVMPKVMQKQHSKKDQPYSLKNRTNSSVPSSSNHYFQLYASYRSPSRKNYGNGVRISPVLNIPHACISSSVNLFGFGFGSLFCNGKSKKKKKCNY